MAKPTSVRGLDPGRKLRPNARRILATRIADVYGFEGAVTDPANVRELHDMRIACKRLRYLLEIFTPAFETDLEPFIDEVKELQDLLGDIHDRDVQVPMLEDHLRWLERREGEATGALLDEAPRVAPRRRGPELARFTERFAESRRADERPGIHALIARRRRERAELYAEFLDRWRGLRTSRFRARLQRAIGVRAD